MTLKVTGNTGIGSGISTESVWTMGIRTGTGILTVPNTKTGVFSTNIRCERRWSVLLNKQVKIYALDTGNFYSKRESRLHWHINELRHHKRKLTDKLSGMDEGDEGYEKVKEAIANVTSAIKDSKDRLLEYLRKKTEENIKSGGKHHTRYLDERTLGERNVIAVFDSYFTRTIGAKEDEFCEDFMVITKFYDEVMKDLIYHGFVFKGERYVYFTSSAGQIRTKKCVFVKESTWLKYQKSIMCGLTVEDINAKGGNNPNKHLAYLALANSATDVWEEFDIDKTIVIDDFGTDVYGTFDFIDDSDYSVTRKTDYAAIEHTDGSGMMLPDAFGKKQRNMMVRLPWVKGLLGVFDFVKFIEDNEGSPIINDIYGKEHNIVTEGIQVIFTKSQFKMWKYYDSWEHYKELYKKYGCTAGVTNIEEERIKDATINYQMLQSLTDITDDEIEEIAQQSIDRLNGICDTKENMMRTMGITPYNTNKTDFQKAVELYPNLLNDEYAKKHIRNIKESMVKKFRSGKLNVHGKYTFVIPDFYAACQHWFLGIENPNGLLEDQEVFCWLFRKSEKLDCLRSPHLYKEHAVRINVACRKYKDRQAKIREWFTTDAIYTSCKDLISGILQFDVDGDKLLVVSDEKLIEVAERNMHDIVPLYYNMRKAESTILNSESIYNGLNAAFTGGNIGIYSNNISKIWNSDVFLGDDEDAKSEAIDIVKLLCMENNYVIDYAKTLYKPERPKHINEKITAFTNQLLPHFFKYAKDKNDSQVIEANKSFVNKLEKLAPNPKISCKKLGLGEIDYMLLMDDPLIDFDENDPLIKKYCSFDREYYFTIDAAISGEDEQQAGDRFAKKVLKYKQMSERVRYELSQFGYSEKEVADILVRFLYGKKTNRNKTIFWICYGDYIVKNLERYYKHNVKTIQCVDCGEWFEVPRDKKHLKTCRCDECDIEYKSNLKSEQNKRAYSKKQMIQ